MSHEDYLAKFTSKERYNIRSRQRGLEKKSDFDFELIDTEEGLTPVIEEYIKVSMASWKDPTSMINDWIFDLMVLAARHDMLRLGILRLDGVAVAVQFWLVSAGVAHSVHIAYDEEYKRRHVGVVLTNLMIGIVLDRDHAKEMSYGFGNEPYKSTWMRDSRFFCGYAGFNSRSFRGNLQGVLHIIGRPAKKLVLRLLGRAPEEDIDPEISK